MKYIQVPAWEWYGKEPENLGFPDSWTVHEQRMNGHSSPALSHRRIAEKIADPIGQDTIANLAKGKRKCCILFDDMTRPTKTYQMLPSVLQELHKAGLTEDQITFIMAGGAHAGRLLPDFQKKLGLDVPEKYLVFNHNCYEHLEDLGVTSRGTPVKINKELMSADLKISLGCMIPHFGYGFGGGSKMLLPGVAGYETIVANHAIGAGTGTGRVNANARRLDSEEAARIAGLDFIVNAFLNSDGDVVDLVAGDPVDAHRAGVEIGRRHYATEVVKNVDIAIGNGYPMSNEGYKANRILVESVRKGGDIVMLLYTPEGCRIHNYNGRFGEEFGGVGWSPDKYVKRPWKMERVICVAPELSRVDQLYYGRGSQWVKTWDQCLELLKEKHGNHAEVAVYPMATTQMSIEKAGYT